MIDTKKQAGVPPEHRQAYALEIIANTLEQILGELQDFNAHLKNEAALARLKGRG